MTVAASLIVAVEDPPSEAVATKLLLYVGLSSGPVTGLRGKGWLKRKAQGLNNVAHRIPVFMLVDQDTPEPCPHDLVSEWVRGTRCPQFYLRVAVMEVESWVLAHREAVSQFLQVPLARRKAIQRLGELKQPPLLSGGQGRPSSRKRQ